MEKTLIVNVRDFYWDMVPSEGIDHIDPELIWDALVEAIAGQETASAEKLWSEIRSSRYAADPNAPTFLIRQEIVPGIWVKSTSVILFPLVGCGPKVEVVFSAINPQISKENRFVNREFSITI